jgi:hypothetical protein
VLAELPNTLHSRSRRGVFAARLTSERPGSFVLTSKTFTLLGSTFIASVAVDVI